VTLRDPVERWDHVTLSIPSRSRLIALLRYYRAMGYRLCLWPPYEEPR